MRPAILTQYCPLLLLALVALTDLGEAQSPADKKLKTSTQTTTKRRGPGGQPLRSAQRGRKKSIWSYKPGHRSLAFLIAGEIVTSPPVDLDQESEYRCLGCCEEDGAHSEKEITDPTIDNRLEESVLGTRDLNGIAAEPNSINDRCLGCCVEAVTSNPRGAVESRGGTTTGAARRTGKQTTEGQLLRPAPGDRNQKPLCVQQDCATSSSSESDSSSKESAVRKEIWTMVERRRSGQLQPLQHHIEERCRHLGCRSALGSYLDSSSEED